MSPGNATNVAVTGLTEAEAAARLAADGPNELKRAETVSPVRLLLAQFASPVIWLLLGACVISVLLKEVADSIAIGSIVIINGLVGFFQEYRAERAVLALRSMTAPRARVLRGGRPAVIPASDVVVGDVLLLEEGDIVAADAKLLSANLLATNEAPLTGESLPVSKAVLPGLANARLAERKDCVFTGTSVVGGTGQAVVTATGMKTELGKIAHLLATAEESATPLQLRLATVSKLLLGICLGLVAIVGVLGLIRRQPLMEVFMSAVSLAVAAVPEGLPAIVTIALAIGVQRMAERNVLVRRLPAVETLGAATVICTDKTGTLTTGVMMVRELWGPDHRRILEAAAANCDASWSEKDRSGIGDPTEVALLRAAAERGILREQLEAERPRVHEHPFDAERRMMSILRSDGVLYVKGAVEAVLARCSRNLDGAVEANADLAARGLRVLAIAVGKDREERDLELIGLVGLADPPRTEAIDAVAQAKEAGVLTVMITGDHPVTASAIAKELGIASQGVALEDVVHARATPEEKLKIVRAWKARGAVVAMTGDGVNDAPALREAHIGIAMGKGGTEVTREAADMVLTDDNFASIVAAVREGRGIFENIRKTLVYLLAGNAGELLVMLAASVAGLPVPLLPLHLLWINLVTDGLPALALVTDPPGKDAMKQPPRRPTEPMLGRAEWINIVMTGVLQAGVCLSVFVWALRSRDLQEARNLAFSALVFGELFRAFAARSAHRVFWEVGAFTNLRLLAIVLVSAMVQLGLHHIPATQKLFQLGALSLADCLLALGVGLIPVTLIELQKLARRALAPHPERSAS